MGLSALCRSSVAAFARSCSVRVLAGVLAAAAGVSGASASQLDTIYAGGNGLGTGAIVYFDLNVTTGITITSLDVNLSSAAGTSCTVDVYVTAAGGTYVGNTTNAGAWTLVGSGTGTAAGAGLHTPVDVSDFTLNPGTYGVGVKYTGAGMNYTNGNGNTTPGSGTNQTYTAPEFTLLAGASQGAPFTGALNQPRVWNGSIYYVQSNPTATGACCTATALCTFGTAAACQTSGGFFSGENTSCTPNVCPHRGACCSSTSVSCTFSSNGAAGCASGTTYQGDATSCSPNICPPPPPPTNDNCSDVVTANAPRIPAAGGTVTGFTTNATDDGGTSCGNGGHNDVYFLFTPATTSSWTFATCGTTPTFDTIVSVHTGCPADATTQVAGGCNDDSCGLLSSITVSGLSSGTQYIVRVANYAAGTAGSFTLAVTAAQLGACCNTTSGACTTSTTGAAGCGAGTTYQGDNTVCSPSPCPQEACCNTATGACTLAAAGACASGTTGQGSGSTCATVTCPAEACCNAASGACTLAGPGQCPSGTTGQGSGTSCTVNPCPQPPPPANDDCANAQALTLNVAFSGNNAQATGDGTEGPGGACYTTSPTHFNKGVWFSFTAPATDVFGITACGSSFDTVLSVFDGTCTAFGSELGCDDDTCDGVTPPGSGLASIIAPVPMTAGQTYLIRLSSWGTGNGAYTITVTGTAPTSGVCCRGATCNTTVTSAAACTSSLIPGQTAGAAFVANLTACNTTGNTTTPCCYANYNKTGGISVQDIFDFLNDWFAGSPYANTGGSGAPGSLAVQNIFDFLNAWFAGGCS